VSLRVVGSRPVGIGHGDGRLHSRFVALEATRRRVSPRTVTGGVWLPSSNGSIVAGESASP
jgi:hypothetical protein